MALSIIIDCPVPGSIYLVAGPSFPVAGIPGVDIALYNQIEILQSLVTQTTAFNNDPNNSIENKKAIVAACKVFLDIPKGMMMSTGGQSDAPGTR